MFNCPYCHGWEVRIWRSDPGSATPSNAIELADWSRNLTVFANGQASQEDRGNCRTFIRAIVEAPIFANSRRRKRAPARVPGRNDRTGWPEVARHRCKISDSSSRCESEMGGPGGTIDS